MDYYDRIRNMIKDNHGIITSSMVKEHSIPSIYLTRMVKQGELKRMHRGIYGTRDAVYDEYYIIYLKNKRIIYSFASALFLHGLTDRIPYPPEVTLPHDYNSSHIEDDIIIHKVMKKYHGVGRIMKVTMFEHEVPAYDMERTLCDLVRFREKIDVEIFKKAVQSYKRHDERDYNKLRQYARIFNISTKINELLDVI